jgi:serine phosphatase RsbU (regulator of sigma subunit)/anti-sigma regulatory factor (Ser/Thr protein kinase)
VEASPARLRQLQAITEAALAHLDFAALVDELLTRLRTVLEVDTAAVLLLDEERDELVARAAKGLEEEVDTEVRVPVGSGFAGRIAAERRPIVVPDVDRVEIVNPILPEKGVRSLLGVPLLVEGRLIGVLHVGSLAPREFSDDDSELLQLAADRIALAIDHARLYEAEREARAAAELAAERLRRIETITEVALHHIAVDEAILERLLSRVRRVLEADVAALFVAEDATQVAVARDQSDGERVERHLEIPPGTGFARYIEERDEPVAVTDMTQVDFFSPLLRESSVRGLLGVPLRVEERMLGVLFVGSTGPRAFTAADLSLLELAGERLAVALDRSQMYEREHFVAETLQRSLLPERLPEVTGASAASRYLPGEGEAVGGDWYDLIPLRDGRAAVAMGDVVSRGVRAASVMGQLRNALRAYALDDHEPVAVLERLDTVARGMEGREMATLVYAVFDPVRGSLTYATAGHPPPLLIQPDGDVALLDDGRGPPLGALPDPVYSEGSARLEPGATLIVYTDGLVERRDMWIDEGIGRLVEAARGAAGREAGAAVEIVVDALVGDAPAADDVAVLALRADPAPSGVLRLTLPAEPTVLAAMRHSLRQWLEDAGAGTEETYDVLVATTEAAANAVEHAYGPIDATFELEARKTNGEVEVFVRDTGSWRPPRGQNRGRGTLLMQELMDHFEVTTGDAGTEVRMSKRLARALAA